MDYIITPEQLDKMTKLFFDMEFKDCKFGEYSVVTSDGNTWYGVINQDNVLLVGHPRYDSDNYYTNGHHFSNMWKFFGVEPNEFTQSMGRYIKKKYGVDFKSIM